MPQFRWPASMWPAWQALGNQESGWNAYAVNASSGAYGIGQSLGHGHPYNLGDYKTQVIWMANYIKGRYGNPVAAEQHELANRWYRKGGKVADHGTTLSPGWNPPIYNGTGRPEQLANVTSSGGGGMSAGDTAIIAALRENTRAVREQAMAFGRVLSGTASAAASRGYYGAGG
jgi:hypothetical protein